VNKSPRKARSKDGCAGAEITSLSQFIDLMAQFEPAEPMRKWCRGHASAAAMAEPLLPSALRRDFHRKESDQEKDEIGLNDEFRRAAAQLLPVDATGVEIYFIARHHGLPTRLLDWTANPLAALFFAAKEAEQDGELIVILPDWELTFGDAAAERSAELPQPPLAQRHSLVASTVAYLFGEGERPTASLILPVRPDLRGSRIWHQDARFTLHMPGCPQMQLNKSNSDRFRVPQSAKPRLIKELDAVGVNLATLFPDLDHIVEHLQRTRRFERA
jgi:hypothetical protein